MIRFRWMFHVLGRVMFVSAVLALLICGGCGKPDASQRYTRPADVTDFAVLFGKNCSGCHGMDGQLGPAPPLNDPLFHAIVSDDQLTQIIQRGRAGTLMPAFEGSHGGPLTEQQVQIIVNGIRRKWVQPTSYLSTSDLPTDIPAYQISPNDPAGLLLSDVAAGQQLFADVCSGCHGDQGQGDTAGPLNKRALTELLSDQLLRRIMITGRADLGMPNYDDLGNNSSLGHALTSKEISDIAAYVRSLQREQTKSDKLTLAK